MPTDLPPIDEPVPEEGPETPRPGRKSGWSKGQSGNVKGRPIGRRAKLALLLDKMAEQSASDLVSECIRQAQAGDSSMMRLLLERIWPARKGRPIKLELPDLGKEGGHVEALDMLSQAMADGVISAEEASDAANVIATRIKAAEIIQLEAMVTDLERQLRDRSMH